MGQEPGRPRGFLADDEHDASWSPAAPASSAPTSCATSRATRPDWEIVVLDKLTYAGRRENLADLEAHPGLRVRAGRHRRPRRWCAACMAGCQYVVNFAAETHVDRSLYDAGGFIQTDVYGAFVLLEEARRTEALRCSCRSPPTRSTAACETGSSRGDGRAHAAQPVLGEQGRRRPAGLFVLRDLRRARDRHPRLQQLRALPVPGEGHPAVRDPRHRRHPGAALRRRPERARLAARGRPLPRAWTCCSSAGAPGETYNVGGGNEVPNIELTKRILAAGRQAGEPDQARAPTARATTAATASTAASCARWAGRRRSRSTEGLAATVEWYRAHEGWWRPLKEANPAFREHYQRHYEGADCRVSVLVTGVAGFVGWHLVELPARRACPSVGGVRAASARGARARRCPGAVALLEADLEDAPSVRAARWTPRAPDRIVHLAGAIQRPQLSWADPAGTCART